ncbi:hypothetical protein CXG81DRAFT_19638 [Caulochytrium protostelioides]|uniref:Uncharacterized protein n=1 Tax=Caulochytrium protostelioides TaxID=1555241 RepID=A0A4P9X5V8_9FUNG|nr:hypothetical protein CXG81DRAFT_19638 [Caulochytrium protostelioides]|eukprot:RKP00390.1 hypothetical protein CXG81DRAFT_19638 [Caulochytrium protostelioides]
MAVSPDVVDKLKHSLDLAAVLKDENEAYRENFDRLRREHEQLKERYEHIDRELEAANDEKEQIERQTRETVQTLQHTIEQRQQELREVRAQIVPPATIARERLDAQQQQDEAHAARLSGLVETVAACRAETQAARRTAALLQTQLDEAHKAAALAKEEAQHQQQIAVRRLEDQIAALQVHDPDEQEAADAEALHRARRTARDVQMQHAALLDENKEIRAQKEQLRVQLEQTLRTHQRQLTDAHAQHKLVIAEKEGMAAKVHGLEEAGMVAQRRQEELLYEIEDLKNHLAKSTHGAEDAQQSHQAAMQNLKLQHAKASQEYEQTLRDLRDKIASYKTAAATAQAQIHDLQTQLAGKEAERMDAVRLAREDERQTTAAQEVQINSLQQQVDDERRLRLEAEEGALARANGAQHELHTLKEAHSQVQHALERAQQELQQLRVAHQERGMRCDAHEAQHAQTAAALREAREALAAWQAREDALTSQNAALVAQHEATTREWVAQHAQLRSDVQALEAQLEAGAARRAQDRAQQQQHVQQLTMENTQRLQRIRDLESQFEKAEHAWLSKTRAQASALEASNAQLAALQAQVADEQKKADKVSSTSTTYSPYGEVNEIIRPLNQ